jgi:sigma-B regulation protein RsbU (phosphoserine phosphatase)
MNQQLLDWMRRHKTPFMSNTPRSDERFKEVLWDETVRSLISVPLIARSELVGTLTVFNKRDGKGFNEDDKRLLAIIGSQSAQVLENARLCEEEKQLALMREEMRLAAECQRSLLPKESPVIPGYEVAGVSSPAKIVGGDYYDFVALEDGRWAICVGDVSGKGIPASLLMANLQATIRGQLLVTPSASECVHRANKLLCRSSPDHRFVTFFLGILDPIAHRFDFCNGGHNPPFIATDEDLMVWLHAGGPPIGMFPDQSYEDDRAHLKNGDLLLIYSDGITEALNSDGEEFGESGLVKLAERHRQDPPKTVLREVMDTIHQFTGMGMQGDDMTLVALKRQST